MHQVGVRPVGESSVKFAGDGERRRHDGFRYAQSGADALRERRLACAQRTTATVRRRRAAARPHAGPVRACRRRWARARTRRDAQASAPWFRVAASVSAVSIVSFIPVPAVPVSISMSSFMSCMLCGHPAVVARRGRRSPARSVPSFVADQFDGTSPRVDGVAPVGFALFVRPGEHADALPESRRGPNPKAVSWRF